jgi:hypothetical protein
MNVKDIEIGKAYKTVNSDEYIIKSIAEKLSTGHKKYTIQFINTGWETTVHQSSIIAGQIKDRMKPSVFGVGYIRNASTKNNKYWNTWHNMLNRCYNQKSKDYNSYGGIGVTVCDRWKCFEFFIQDIKLIDGYNDFDFDNKSIVLDKDLKQVSVDSAKKIYSPETCCFIDKKTNQELRNTSKYKKEIVAINPNGEKIKIKGIVNFCKQNAFDVRNIYRCLNGEWQQYKGWQFSKITE